MTARFNTIVIGAGHAGLATSYYLTQQGRNHIVLEKQRIGEAWRSAKWDSFTLVTPNWALRLPGFPYQGDDPDGFLTRDEVVRYLEAYSRSFNAPVRTGIEVTSIEQDGARFRVSTDSGVFEADNVVIAAGTFQMPRIPAYSTRISGHIRQLHSSQYRNPQALPEGAVLIIGSGQSGCQIAEELQEHGRRVYLCTSGAGNLPRRYRGRDIFHWAELLGVLDQPVEKLPSPAARFTANPQLTGKDGGHTVSLHHLALSGVTLLGRLQAADGSALIIADDLMANLARADEFATEFKQAVDEFIAQNGLQAPPDDAPELRAGYESKIITELDLDAAGISVIIWATGYAFDYSWIKFPIFDEFGYPTQKRGVTAVAGLYFVGLHWQRVAKSDLFAGIGEDAAYVVEQIAARDAMHLAD